MSSGSMSDRAVRIGEAAALYGLAASTVRWWEQRGVLDPPARDRGGQRVYRDADLRRIGLAYLCCVVGKMPLQQAAVVTSGEPTNDAWQRSVREQIEAVGQRIEQLAAARDYLRHLLHCTDDDMARCGYLDGELLVRTPRGRLPETDLVAAARAASLGDESQACRDEKWTRCVECPAPVPRNTRGRPRKYCSPACRQRGYRARRSPPA